MQSKPKVSFGSVSSGTLRSEDLIPAFADELRRIRGALPRSLANEVRAFHAGKYDTDHGCDVELVNDLIDALNDYAPDYCYFCVVNDHGNVTLYATRDGIGTLAEVWSAV